MAGVVLIGWLFYLGATWGPRPVDSAPGATAQTADPFLLEESQRLAREFEAIVAHRDPTEQELNLLRDAIGKQREYNLAGSRTSSEDRRRLEALEDRLGSFVARGLHAESMEAEAEAQRLLEGGEVAAAVARMQRAHELQRRINQDFSRSGFRDASRESRLQQAVVSMEAAPLYQRSVELERQGETAAAELQWDRARGFFEEALQLQVRINETSRRGSYYDASRAQHLNNQIALLRVGEMSSEVNDLQKRGEEQEGRGEWEAAAQLYERAMVTQNQINRNHPQSRFVSTTRVTELDASRQSALSARQGLELEKNLGELRQALRTGDLAAVGEKIETGRRLLTQISERFPRSRYADFNVRLELDFLALMQPALPELQLLLRDQLLPVPGRQEWHLSKRPVSQQLFSRVMNANPSRNRGDDLPVDSVTLSQAREFCRRSSWVLGRPVRLPEKAAFEAAVGEWDAALYADHSWHKENSDGSSKPVTTGSPNSHGFFHLVGNLRHWIDGGSENGAFWTAGASFADELPEESLFQRIASDQRDPTIGFRYMVKVE